MSTYYEFYAAVEKDGKVEAIGPYIIAGGTGEMYSFKANGLMDEIRHNIRTDICER